MNNNSINTANTPVSKRHRVPLLPSKRICQYLLYAILIVLGTGVCLWILSLGKLPLHSAEIISVKTEKSTYQTQMLDEDENTRMEDIPCLDFILELKDIETGEKYTEIYHASSENEEYARENFKVGRKISYRKLSEVYDYK